MKVILSASPLISGKLFALEDVDGLIVKKVSRNVCIWNVPGVSAVGIQWNVSSGDMASVVADNMPYLSQLKYLRPVSAVFRYL